MNENKNEIMDENEGEREFYTLVDADNGEEIEFEKIAEVELGGKKYVAMIPAEAADKAQDDGGFCEYVVLRLEKDENGDDILVTIEDDEEFDRVADYFDDLLQNEIDYDAGNENA